MNNPILSLIIPVYNVEKYLRKCLDSIVKQELINWEVLLINDGSNDNSQAIIDEYTNKYSFFKGYQKENGGLSSARNYGLKIAKGKYIAFLDSDDCVATNYYRGMLEKALTFDADLVVSDLEYVWEDNSRPNLRKEGYLKVNEVSQKALFLAPLFSWNKLYKHSLFIENKLSYPQGLWYEDILVSLQVFALSKKIAYYEKVGVYYLQRQNSIMSASYNVKMFDIFTIFELVVTTFKEKGLFKQYYAELEYLFIEHFLVYGAFRFLRTSEYKSLMLKAFSFVKKNFPRYYRNKYIKTLSYKNIIFLYTNNRLTMPFWHWYLEKKSCK